MSFTTTNMALVIPSVLTDIGPTYATLINAAWTTIDAHDHSSGKGVKVTPGGINISSDLTFASNNATNLRTARFFNNSSITPGVNDKTCLYALNNELYYIDGNGNTIQITLSGAINISSVTSLTIKDSLFILQYFADTTRQAKFSIANVPASTTRIFTIPATSADDSFVMATSTQTLTNKTLTAAIITGCTAVNLISGAGTLVLPTSGTITIPNGTDTLVALALTQTLTNKILTGNTIASFMPDGTHTLTAPGITDTLVTRTNTETLSNKSITGPLAILADTTVQFNNSANTFATSLKAGANVANVTFSLPISDGTPGQVMKTDGSGSLAWTSALSFSRGDVATTATITALSSSNSFERLTGSTTTEIQGIAAGSAGQMLTLYNQSSATISVDNQNAGASAANRIITPSGVTVTLLPQWTAQFTYDDSQSRWIVTGIYSSQEWISYTPTYTGLGTVSNNTAYYKIVGDALFLRGFLTTGTVTAALASIAMPSSLIISVNKIRNNTVGNSGSVVGTYSQQNLATASGHLVTAVSTNTGLIYFAADFTSVNALTASNGSTIFQSAKDVSWKAEVPLF